MFIYININITEVSILDNPCLTSINEWINDCLSFMSSLLMDILSFIEYIYAIFEYMVINIITYTSDIHDR